MLGRCFDLFGPASCSDFKALNWCAMPVIRENCCITCGQGDEIEPEGNSVIRFIGYSQNGEIGQVGNNRQTSDDSVISI
jgi:hypothetical protein